MRLLHQSLRSVALRCVLAALLLIAQHGALTHALVHASGHAHEAVVHEAAVAIHASSHDEGHAHAPVSEGRSASAACDLDLLYSELLGGALLIDSTITAESVIPVAVISVTAVAVSVTTLPYHSRGPPIRV